MNLKQNDVNCKPNLQTVITNSPLFNPAALLDSLSPEDRQTLINKCIQMRIMIHRKLKEKRGYGHVGIVSSNGGLRRTW